MKKNSETVYYEPRVKPQKEEAPYTDIFWNFLFI